MEENPPRVSRPAGPKPSSSRSKSRFAVEEGGDRIECSGKYCCSCTAGLIADCVALCCCPCAVLHCFALAFVKAPWMMGRRCLGLSKTKRQKTKKKCKTRDDDVVLERKREGTLRKGWVEDGTLETVSGFGEAEETGSGSASF